MTLSEILGNLFPKGAPGDVRIDDTNFSLLKTGRLTDPELLRRSARRVEEMYDEPPEAPKRDREAIAAEIADRLRRGDWSDVRTSRVMMAARAAFDPERRERPDLEPLRAFLIDEWPATDSAGLRSVMADVYLESFEPGARHTRALATALKSILPALPDRWIRLLEALPELRDPSEGPIRLAERMAAMDAPFETLKEAGLRAPHGAGFMEHAHRAYVELLAPRVAVADEAEAERLFAWLSPAPGRILQGGAEHAIRALLVPWREHTPPEPYRQLLMKRLLELYEDPRVQRSGPWAALDRLDETAKSVLLRWLVGATLEAFLVVRLRRDEPSQQIASAGNIVGLQSVRAAQGGIHPSRPIH